MMKEVKFGIVGTGAIFALSHANAIKKIPNASILSIFDVNQDRALECSQKWQIPKVTKNLDELVNDKDINAIVIATPNDTHKEIAIKAANAGKHIFCEKPISVNLQDAYQMIESCNANNVNLQIGFNQRYWSQVQIVKELLEINFIGKVHSFRSIYSEKWDAYPATTQYRYNLEQSGGATMVDLAIHRIDLIRHLLGEYKNIVAELKHSEIPHKVDDNVYILANMQSGSTGVISSDRFSPAIGDGTDLYGSEGAIHFVTETINPFHSVPLAVYTEKKLDEIPPILKNNFYPSAWWKEFEGGWITLQPERENPYEKELMSFCRNITEGKPVEVNGVDGLKALEIIIASYISKKEKKWVDLPLDKNIKVEIPKY